MTKQSQEKIFQLSTLVIGGLVSALLALQMNTLDKIERQLDRFHDSITFLKIERASMIERIKVLENRS